MAILDPSMSAEIPAPNLTTLVNRVSDNTAGQVLLLEDSDVWLETFLEQWANDEEEFFVITLEKEELDMYNRALALHLIGEDEITPRGYALSGGYMRPGAIRHLAKTVHAREAAEQEEANSLKERRRNLRQSLARTNRLLDSMSLKLTNLKLQVSEHDQRVEELSRNCDLLTSECTQAAADNATKLSNEFGLALKSSTLLQTISASLQEKYQLIKSLSEASKHTGTTSEDFLQASWLLGRAFQNLEDRVYRDELLKLSDVLAKGNPFERIEQIPVPTSAVITSRLQSAWDHDEVINLLHKEEILRLSCDVLRSQILPPLILLYMGLVKLQAHVSNVHAQCVVLASELERCALTLQETEPQAPLDEEDDLLIRLSTLLQLDPGTWARAQAHILLNYAAEGQGELSADAVLDQLAMLSKSDG